MTDGCTIELRYEGVAWVAEIVSPGPDVCAQGPDRVTALERLVATLKVEIDEAGWPGIPRRSA